MQAHLKWTGWISKLLTASIFLSGCASGPETKPLLPKLNQLFQKKDASSPLLAKKSQPSASVGPDFFDGMLKGRQLEQQGKLSEAREIYQRLIVQYPHRYEPYHRLGVVADRQKRYREAVALYTQAIALNPDPEIFNDLGYSYYLQGQLDKAESALLKAVSMKPASPRFRNNLGMVYGFQGRYEEALDQFRRGGSEADACYNMAFILATQGKIQEAKRYLMLALAADPTYKKAQEALASLEGIEPNRLGPNPRELAQDGRRWERYREPPSPPSPAHQAQMASYATPLPNPQTVAGSPPTGPKSPTRTDSPTIVHKSAPRPDTQALLRQARAMMAQRMAQRQTTLSQPNAY